VMVRRSSVVSTPAGAAFGRLETTSCQHTRKLQEQGKSVSPARDQRLERFEPAMILRTFCAVARRREKFKKWINRLRTEWPRAA
jgi:hypothetical protein